VEARDTERHVVARADTGPAGRFTMLVSRGTYRIHVLVSGVLPRCPDLTVTSPNHRVLILCDTGIR
jgi:hypothetical protein